MPKNFEQHAVLDVSPMCDCTSLIMKELERVCYIYIHLPCI